MFIVITNEMIIGRQYYTFSDRHNAEIFRNAIENAGYDVIRFFEVIK